MMLDRPTLALLANAWHFTIRGYVMAGGCSRWTIEFTDHATALEFCKVIARNVRSIDVQSGVRTVCTLTT